MSDVESSSDSSDDDDTRAKKAAAGKAMAAEKAPERAKAAAERAVANRVAAERAVAALGPEFGLLQPLEALSLNADTLHRATAAAVAYRDAQGAASFTDLAERASRSIVHPQAAQYYCLGPSVALGCGPAMPSH